MEALKQIGMVLAVTVGSAMALAALRWLWAKAKSATFITKYHLEAVVDNVFAQAVTMTEAYAEKVKGKTAITMSGAEKATKALEVVNQLLGDKALPVPANAAEKINNAVLMMNAAEKAATRPQ
jgi:hypothetical protein